MTVQLLKSEEIVSGDVVSSFPYKVIPFDNSKTISASLQQKSIQLTVKRFFDIVVASLLIIFFAPVLITVAVIIKLTSKGAVLYSNERVGYGGGHFRCFKFRSMR
jgi:lipopolysaccharide/colanic/teichoic acid biosynthesis glycosyltransferase